MTRLSGIVKKGKLKCCGVFGVDNEVVIHKNCVKDTWNDKVNKNDNINDINIDIAI